MTRRPLVLAAAACLAAASVSPPPSADQLEVPGDHATLQAAIDAAQPGDTIVVHGGTHGPLQIDRELQIVGDPRPLIVGGGPPFQFASPIELAGPGSGAVVLAAVDVGGTIDGAQHASAPPGISGGGFDELHLYDCTVRGPEWVGQSGSAFGASAIDATLGFLLLERTDAEASRSVAGSPVFNGPPGVRGVTSADTIAVLDSTVLGGTAGPYSHLQVACGGGCPGGAGGAGLACNVLLRSNADVLGGQGALWTDPFGVVCCVQSDGVDTEVNGDQTLDGRLTGDGPARLGSPFTLTWTTEPGGAVLFGGLGARTPFPFSAGPGFLDPATALFLGPVASPGSVTIPVPSHPGLVGLEVAFQLLHETSGLTRPVSEVLVP